MASNNNNNNNNNDELGPLLQDDVVGSRRPQHHQPPSTANSDNGDHQRGTSPVPVLRQQQQQPPQNLGASRNNNNNDSSSGRNLGQVFNVPENDDMNDDDDPAPVAISSSTSDRPTLLAFMHIRFREKKHSYSYSATFYRRLDAFLFFLPLMFLQCAVAVCYVAANDNAEFQRIFSGCVSAVSAVLIAIQMKLKWGEKAEQFQNGARQYGLLASETFFKWLKSSHMSEAEFQDFVKDTGQLEKEVQDTAPVPPAWVTTKYEQHRLQLTVTSENGTQMTPIDMRGGIPMFGPMSSAPAQRHVPKRANANRQQPGAENDAARMMEKLRDVEGANARSSDLFAAKSRLRLTRPRGSDAAIEMSPSSVLPPLAGVRQPATGAYYYPPTLSATAMSNPGRPGITISGLPPQQPLVAGSRSRTGAVETDAAPAADPERVPFIDGGSSSMAPSPVGDNQPSVDVENNNRPDIRLQSVRGTNWHSTARSTRN